MWGNALFSLMVFLIIASIGDFISIKTKGIVGTILFICIIYIIGFFTGLIPRDALASPGIINIADGFMTACLMCGIAAQVPLRDFLKEWKTVLVALVGCVGVIIIFLTLGRLILGNNYAVAATGPICGGLMAVLATVRKANELGLPLISAFAMATGLWQGLLGIPLTNFLMKRHVDRQIKNGFFEKAAPAMQAQAGKTRRKLIPPLPKKYNTKTVMFCKLIIVVFIGKLISDLTGIPLAVCELILGVFFCAIGFLDEKILGKAELMTFFMLCMMFTCPNSFAMLELQDFLSMLVPMVISILLGGLVLAVVGGLFGKFVMKYDFWLGASVSVCALIGFPLTILIPQDVVSSYNLNEEQSAQLLNYIQPKMMISGFTSVSLASVVIAGFMAELLVA